MKESGPAESRRAPCDRERTPTRTAVAVATAHRAGRSLARGSAGGGAAPLHAEQEGASDGCLAGARAAAPRDRRARADPGAIHAHRSALPVDQPNLAGIHWTEPEASARDLLDARRPPRRSRA